MSTVDLRALGSNLRRARKARGLTLKAIERAAGVSATHVSEIERGKSSPTVGALERIAAAVGVAVTRLLEVDAGDRVHVARAGERRRFVLDDGGFTLSPLSSGAAGREVSFFELRLAAGHDAELRRGGGASEEIIALLEGRLDVAAGRERRTLEEGDAWHVRVRGGLRATNPTGREAVALWVTSPRLAL